MTVTRKDIIEIFNNKYDGLNETEDFKQHMLESLLDTDEIKKGDDHTFSYRFYIQGFIEGFIMGYLESTLVYRISRRFYINVKDELRTLDLEDLKYLMNNLDTFRSERDIKMYLMQHRVN